MPIRRRRDSSRPSSVNQPTHRRARPEKSPLVLNLPNASRNVASTSRNVNVKPPNPSAPVTLRASVTPRTEAFFPRPWAPFGWFGFYYYIYCLIYVLYVYGRHQRIDDKISSRFDSSWMQKDRIAREIFSCISRASFRGKKLNWEEIYL